MAGVLTAVVFYAEYISLGATLGGHIAGVGKDAAAAVGSLLVLGAVWISCLSALLWFLPKPLLAGPRAASVLILIVGLNWVKEHVANPLVLPTAGMLAMGLMPCVAAAVQLLGLLEYVRNWVKAMPPRHFQGVFVHDGGKCSHGRGRQTTWGLSAVQFLAHRGYFFGQCGCCLPLGFLVYSPNRLAHIPESVVLPIGTALAWAGYTLFLPGASSAASCGTLGALGLQLQALTGC